jgi:hypothetical protein
MIATAMITAAAAAGTAVTAALLVVAVALEARIEAVLEEKMGLLRCFDTAQLIQGYSLKFVLVMT